MKITKADESALVIAFAEKIQETTITSYRYAPVGVGWEEGVLESLGNDFRPQLQSKLDGSIEAFFQECIFAVFFENGNKVPLEGNDKSPLTSYLGFSDPLKIAKSFVEKIKSIPRQYVCYTPLNLQLGSVMADNNIEFSFGNQLSVISGDTAVAEVTTTCDNLDFAKYLTRQAMYDSSKIDIEESNFYIKYRQSGYISDRTSPRIISDMSDNIRALYGSLFAHGCLYLFKIKYVDGINHASVIVNQSAGDSQILAYACGVDDDLKLCAGLNLGGDLTKENNTSKIVSIFENIKVVFSSPESQRLKTSAVWLLRSFLSEREMDQILCSAIAVEVLLGDREASDRVGLSKLMANRCAYALGKSEIDRKDITEFFIKWYRLRSEIVHSGRMRVTGDEKKIVSEGKKLASRLLVHEISMNR